MSHNDNRCMREFDVSISGEFEKVPARVLEPPQLAYINNKTVNVSKGVWRADKFFEPSQLIAQDNSWTILNLNRQTQDRDLYYLRDSLIKTGQYIFAHRIYLLICINYKCDFYTRNRCKLGNDNWCCFVAI